MDCRYFLRNRTRPVADLRSETDVAAARTNQRRVGASVAHGNPESF